MEAEHNFFQGASRTEGSVQPEVHVPPNDTAASFPRQACMDRAGICLGPVDSEDGVVSDSLIFHGCLALVR